MKKLLFTLLLVPTLSFAQFSLRPYVGAGLGSVKQEGLLTKNDQSALFIQNAGLSGMYWLNNWFVSTGVEYFTTGYIDELGTLTGEGLNEPVYYFTDARVLRKFQHLGIPVTAGRQFSVKKLALLPEAGIDIVYNLSEKGKFKSKEQTSGYSNNVWFSTDYNRISVFADIKLTISYPLTNRLSIFSGPSYKYMVTNIAKAITNPVTGAAISQNHHAMLLNAGVYINLSK